MSRLMMYRCREKACGYCCAMTGKLPKAFSISTIRYRSVRRKDEIRGALQIQDPSRKHVLPFQLHWSKSPQRQITFWQVQNMADYRQKHCVYSSNERTAYCIIYWITEEQFSAMSQYVTFYAHIAILQLKMSVTAVNMQTLLNINGGFRYGRPPPFGRVIRKFLTLIMKRLCNFIIQSPHYWMIDSDASGAVLCRACCISVRLLPITFMHKFNSDKSMTIKIALLFNFSTDYHVPHIRTKLMETGCSRSMVQKRGKTYRRW